MDDSAEHQCRVCAQLELDPNSRCADCGKVGIEGWHEERQVVLCNACIVAPYRPALRQARHLAQDQRITEMEAEIVEMKRKLRRAGR